MTRPHGMTLRMMAPDMGRRRPAIAAALVVTAVGAVACGSQGISLEDRRAAENIQHGAELFAEHCSGCHTLDVGRRRRAPPPTCATRERIDGPNFNQRNETPDSVLYAIRNGGFSGAIMPENIVIGQDADDVADFLAKYAGSK